MKKLSLTLLAFLTLAACGIHHCKGIEHCYQVRSGLPQFSKTTLIYVKYLYHGGWKRDQTKVIYTAKQYLLERVKEKNKKLAIVFNLDETLLRSPYLLDYEPSSAHIKKEQLQGNYKAIKPTLKLYNLAKKRHVAVFIITGRTEDQKASTIKNLQLQGITGWTGLYFKSSAIENAAHFKTQIRKQITDKGYKIIINVGDQFSDLCGGYSETSYKLPNPFYYVPGCE